MGTVMGNMKFTINAESPQDELLELGRILHSRDWTDAEIKKEFGPDYLPWFIKMAKRFHNLPDHLKFRALVEDWTPELVAIACGMDPEETDVVYGSEENNG